MRRAVARWCWRVVFAAIGMALWLALPSDSAWADDETAPADGETAPADGETAPADGETAPAKYVSAQFEVQPAIVSPGTPLTYTLTLSNPLEVQRRVVVSATLPAGFELPLTALPVGASYSLQSGSLRWVGNLAARSVFALVFPGFASSELLRDGWLTAYAALDDGIQLTHLSATSWAGTPPTATFTYSLGGGQPQASRVDFTNLSRGVGPLSAWWEFGDGTVSSESSPVHEYPAPGEYDVRLTVANPRGASTATRRLFIASPADQLAPRHQILVSDDTPAVGQLVYFMGPSEAISATVHWSFGDGVTTGEAEPVYVYRQPGIYTVTRVLGEGATAVQASRVLAVDRPPQASIYTTRSTVRVGELVTFTALTTAAEVVSYYWDFGDGNSASHAYVAHSYGTPGSYSVTLAVSNDFGVALDTLAMRASPYVTYLPLVANQGGLPSMPELAVEPEPVIPLPADPLARQTWQAVNAEREAAGLHPLAWSGRLARSAQHHSNDMASNGFTGHIGSNGSRPIDRMRQASYAGDYAGECTGWGFDDIASALAWWMTSPPHRTIILSTVATEMGGAYSHNPDAPSVHYWTIDFGAGWTSADEVDGE